MIESTVNALEKEDEIVPEFILAGFIMEDEFMKPEFEHKIHQLDTDKKPGFDCSMIG